jgi:hypothetical protein
MLQFYGMSGENVQKLSAYDANAGQVAKKPRRTAAEKELDKEIDAETDQYFRDNPHIDAAEHRAVIRDVIHEKLSAYDTNAGQVTTATPNPSMLNTTGIATPATQATPFMPAPSPSGNSMAPAKNSMGANAGGAMGGRGTGNAGSAGTAVTGGGISMQGGKVTTAALLLNRIQKVANNSFDVQHELAKADSMMRAAKGETQHVRELLDNERMTSALERANKERDYGFKETEHAFKAEELAHKQKELEHKMLGSNPDLPLGRNVRDAAKSFLPKALVGLGAAAALGGAYAAGRGVSHLLHEHKRKKSLLEVHKEIPELSKHDPVLVEKFHKAFVDHNPELLNHPHVLGSELKRHMLHSEEGIPVEKLKLLTDIQGRHDENKRSRQGGAVGELVHNILTRKTASMEKAALGGEMTERLKSFAKKDIPFRLNPGTAEKMLRLGKRVEQRYGDLVSKIKKDNPGDYLEAYLGHPRAHLYSALYEAARLKKLHSSEKVSEDHTFGEHLKKNLKSIGSKALVGGVIAGTAGGAIYAAKKIMEGHRRRVDEKARAGELSQFTRENPDIDPAIAAKHHAMIRELAPVLSKNKDAMRDVIRAHARAGNPVSVSDLKDLAEMQNMHEETVRSRSNPTHELLSNIRV